MSYNDKTIPCRDCGGQFVFTAGEQAFYVDKGFINEPTRCAMRRRLRKDGKQSKMAPGTVCPYDVSFSGQAKQYPIQQQARQRSTSTGRRARQPYTGPLPSGPVLATVLRVDPTGRFLFARVQEGEFDVYVHASLFQDIQLDKYDKIYLTIEAHERGPRAKSLQLAQEAV